MNRGDFTPVGIPKAFGPAHLEDARGAWAVKTPSHRLDDQKCDFVSSSPEETFLESLQTFEAIFLKLMVHRPDDLNRIFRKNGYICHRVTQRCPSDIQRRSAEVGQEKKNMAQTLPKFNHSRIEQKVFRKQSHSNIRQLTHEDTMRYPHAPFVDQTKKEENIDSGLDPKYMTFTMKCDELLQRARSNDPFRNKFDRFVAGACSPDEINIMSEGCQSLDHSFDREDGLHESGINLNLGVEPETDSPKHVVRAMTPSCGKSKYFDIINTKGDPLRSPVLLPKLDRHFQERVTAAALAASRPLRKQVKALEPSLRATIRSKNKRHNLTKMIALEKLKAISNSGSTTPQEEHE